MRTSRTTGLFGLLTAAALVTAVGCSSGESTPPAQQGQGQGQEQGQEQGQPGRQAVGLTADGLSVVTFDTANPAGAAAPAPLAGLQGDGRLVGIDFRPQDSRLYGVGDQGGLYAATPDNRTMEKVGQLSVPLEGQAFGVDFNPGANALRVVSDTGQNLRQPFAFREGGGQNPATTVDTPLTSPQPPPATGTMPATGVTAAAYTNNDTAPPPATALFVINTNTDQVAIQSPANNGTLAASGPLGVDATGAAGFDVYSTPGGQAPTEGNEAFAVLQVGGTPGLFGVDLLTGAATRIGDFGVPVADLAVATTQP